MASGPVLPADKSRVYVVNTEEKYGANQHTRPQISLCRGDPTQRKMAWVRTDKRANTLAQASHQARNKSLQSTKPMLSLTTDGAASTLMQALAASVDTRH